jgi:hypothetical protein
LHVVVVAPDRLLVAFAVREGFTIGFGARDKGLVVAAGKGRNDWRSVVVAVVVATIAWRVSIAALGRGRARPLMQRLLGAVVNLERHLVGQADVPDNALALIGADRSLISANANLELGITGNGRRIDQGSALLEHAVEDIDAEL